MTSLVADLVAAAKASPYARCIYCGYRCYGRACQGHRDLPQLETQTQSPPRDLAVVTGTGFDNTGG